MEGGEGFSTIPQIGDPENSFLVRHSSSEAPFQVRVGIRERLKPTQTISGTGLLTSKFGLLKRGVNVGNCSRSMHGSFEYCEHGTK